MELPCSESISIFTAQEMSGDLQAELQWSRKVDRRFRYLAQVQ